MKGNILPLDVASNFSMTNWNGGKLLFWLEYRGTYMNYDKRGFFSSYEFHAERTYTLFVLNPLQVSVHIGKWADGDAPVDFPAIDREKFYTERFASIKWLGASDLTSFSTWETVNSHEWSGRKPIQRKNGNGQVIEEEPPCWEVAGVLNGKRISAYLGHNHRNDVFAYNLRINAFFDYWQALLAPLREDILRLNPKSGDALGDVEDEKDRAELKLIVNEIVAEVRKNPPP